MSKKSRQKRLNAKFRVINTLKPLNLTVESPFKGHKPLNLGDRVMIKQGNHANYPGAKGRVEHIELKFSATQAIIRLDKVNSAGMHIRVRLSADYLYVLTDGETRPERPKITVEHLVPYNELLGKVG